MIAAYDRQLLRCRVMLAILEAILVLMEKTSKGIVQPARALFAARESGRRGPGFDNSLSVFDPDAIRHFPGVFYWQDAKGFSPGARACCF